MKKCIKIADNLFIKKINNITFVIVNMQSLRPDGEFFCSISYSGQTCNFKKILLMQLDNLVTLHTIIICGFTYVCDLFHIVYKIILMTV